MWKLDGDHGKEGDRLGDADDPLEYDPAGKCEDATQEIVHSSTDESEWSHEHNEWNGGGDEDVSYWT